MSDEKEPVIPDEDFKRIIEDFIQSLKQREEELKRPKKASGGFIEKPIYYTQKPGLEQIITRYRKRLSDGGTPNDDVNIMRYLFSVLENAIGLTDYERKLREDLKKDLEKIDGKERR